MSKADIQLFLARRRTAYVKSFEGAFGDEVIRDLERFCRASESTFHPDARVHALLEGRREVFLRILDHLKLSDEQLLAKYASANVSKSPEGITND